MKSTLMMKLVAVPALSLSSFAFAAEPASSELVLSASQMDGVTAGFYFRSFNFQQQNNTTNQTQAYNINVSPAVGTQALAWRSGQVVTGGSISQSNGTVQVMR